MLYGGAVSAGRGADFRVKAGLSTSGEQPREQRYQDIEEPGGHRSPWQSDLGKEQECASQGTKCGSHAVGKVESAEEIAVLSWVTAYESATHQREGHAEKNGLREDQ